MVVVCQPQGIDSYPPCARTFCSKYRMMWSRQAHRIRMLIQCHSAGSISISPIFTCTIPKISRSFMFYRLNRHIGTRWISCGYYAAVACTWQSIYHCYSITRTSLEATWVAGPEPSDVPREAALCSENNGQHHQFISGWTQFPWQRFTPKLDTYVHKNGGKKIFLFLMKFERSLVECFQHLLSPFGKGR